MNFESLEYFSALAQERSFTRAAQTLHITQQSLSSHIAGLEKELGCQLVVRSIPLELTFAGKTFLRYAEDIRRTRHTMQQELCDISKNQKGELRIGIAFTRGRALMPGLIGAFQKEYPNVRVALMENSNDAFLQMLQEGEIDLAVAEFSRPAPEIELQDFCRESVVLCIAQTLLAQCGIDLEAHQEELYSGDLQCLGQCPFVMGSAEDIAGRIGREMLRRCGVEPIVKASSANIETLLALCVQGVGACFTPENLLHEALSGPKIRQLRLVRFQSGTSYPIRFGYLKRSYQWSVIENFIRIARESIG